MLTIAFLLAVQTSSAPQHEIGFVAAPTEEQYQAAYPSRAREAKLDGKVSLHCDVATAGELNNCTVTEEAPAGFDFGAQSLTLVPLFRIGPGPFPPNKHTTIPLNWLVSGSWPSAAPAKLSWLRTPTGADYAYYYPERAIRNEVTGRASLHCVVKADGYVTDCKVISETPSGYNFGEASLRVSSKFQMPTMVDGKSTEGSEVTIPLIWILQ